MDKEWKSLELWRSVIAECLGTFFYVFLACTVTLNWTPNVYKVSLTTSDVLQLSLAAGLALCTLTQCFGHISGGHINPAVSIATLVTCKVTPLRGILYVIAQCGGGIAGAALLYGIVPEDTRGHLGSTTLNPSLTSAQGFGVEFLMTFILTFTFFATIDPKRRNNGNEAIPLGLTMTLLHIVGYRLTGSSCNPARSLGPAFVRNTWANHWVYWAGPIAGSVVAGLLYQFVFAHTRGYKHKACSLSQLNNNNDQNEASFGNYGNSKNKKKTTETAAPTTSPPPPPVPNNTPASTAVHMSPAVIAPEDLVYSQYPSDLATAYFRAETVRKYMAQLHQEPRAPPGSVETGLDLVVPQSSQISSDATSRGLDVDVIRQRSLCSGSSDYEIHEMENVVNSLKNVV